MNQLEEFCQQIGFKPEIVEFDKSTRTAPEAAQTLGCEINQIGKSIIFKNQTTGKPLLAIVAGGNRVDEAKIEKEKGWIIEKMNADEVYLITGFPIGGVAPFGHKTKITTLIDNNLFKYKDIWVAAGKVNAVFKIEPERLGQLTEAAKFDF